MQIYDEHQIFIQKSLSKHMSYREIVQKINISKSAVSSEIKIKSMHVT